MSVDYFRSKKTKVYNHSIMKYFSERIDVIMPRDKKPGRFLNAKVSDETFDRVEDYSKKSLLPKTAIVEFALREYLDKYAGNKGLKRRK